MEQWNEMEVPTLLSYDTRLQHHEENQEAWNNMLKHMTILLPQNICHILNTHTWWNPSIIEIGYGIP